MARWTDEHDKRARLISERMIATFGDDQDDVARLCREIAELMVGSCDEIERLQAERDTILNAMRNRPDRIDEFLAWYDEQKQEAVNG